MRPPFRAWTGDEQRCLRIMWADGVPVARICEALDRTKDSVLSRRRDLGLPSRYATDAFPNYRRYTPRKQGRSA